VIAAIGKAEFVKADWLKEGAVVIDVGINAVDVSGLFTLESTGCCWLSPCFAASMHPRQIRSEIHSPRQNV
jgi:hypothetical protein